MSDKDIEKEIKEMEGKLKSLKQKSGGGEQNPYLIPGAILIVGVLLTGAIIFTQGNNNNAPGGTTPPGQVAGAPQDPSGGLSDNVKPVIAADHILGDRNAPVKIIEFSDIECPFCNRLHPVLQQVMDEYGDSGDVAWVYRHFPLDALHSKARIEASATELANELGGNDAFWAYLDRVFEITPANNGLDLALLPQIAEDVGLPRAPFDALVAENDLRGGKFADHIEDNVQDATASGGNGTPYTIIVAKNGKTFAISGAQPYSAFQAIIELALKEK